MKISMKKSWLLRVEAVEAAEAHGRNRNRAVVQADLGGMVSWSGGSQLVLDYAAGAGTLDFRIHREIHIGNS